MTIHVTVGLSLRHSLLTVNYTSMIISFLGLPFNGRSKKGKEKLSLQARANFIFLLGDFIEVYSVILFKVFLVQRLSNMRSANLTE